MASDSESDPEMGEKPDPKKKYRDWVFTINNYTDDDCDRVISLEAQAEYLICGKEIGKKNGTPHLQGYVYFRNARHFAGVKNCLPRAYLEHAVRTALENQRYCSKQGNVLIESGTIPKQGKRSDIDNVRDVLREGGKMRDVSETATSFQSIKMAEVWLKYHEKERTWKPDVRWYWGPTGVGKTKTAREWLAEDIYTALDTIKWWEGYDAHENVLIDDMRKDFAKFHQLLKLLDRYPYKVETKGGSRQFLAKKIAITAPYHPRELYETREDLQQLLRRVDEIIEIQKDFMAVDTSHHDDQIF